MFDHLAGFNDHRGAGEVFDLKAMDRGAHGELLAQRAVVSGLERIARVVQGYLLGGADPFIGDQGQQH